MTISECQVETIKHIEKVRKYLRFFTDKITTRGVNHDMAKLDSPEVELFAEYTPKLSQTVFGSQEYKTQLEGLKPALEHHYATYRHHPEHFPNGINDMNLIDIIEMLADWKAASERQRDGNLIKSIEINASRFHLDDQLKHILLNTAKVLDEENS